DAFFLLGLLTRNCTGQAITSYVSVLNGPRRSEEEDGPETMYVIIVDNGRSQAYQDAELKEALRCIRCGRCGIQCPIYMRVGAYPYGNCYPGPMGNVLAPLVMGLKSTKDLYEACTLCGACQAICPSRLPHVDLFLQYRQMKASDPHAAGSNLTERMGFKLWSMGIQKLGWYKTGTKLVRRYLQSAGKDGYISKLRGPAAGWFVSRDLPVPDDKSFRERWQEGLGQEAGQIYDQAAAAKEAGQ
ncbi:MAG: 4Fe-4S dicluster domain-containing protein, partial [Methylocystaceae bacterium]